MAKVSQREMQIIDLIFEGKTTREIAQLLRISHNTVRAHRRTIFQKLQINSIALLVRARAYGAITQGVIG